MWQFHTTLSSPHAYAAPAWGWLVQWRPTSFYWRDDPAGAACGAVRCVQAITSVGNPVLWWSGIAALAVLAVAAVRLRDWRAWTVLAGYLATWAPWLAFPHRTMFTFYAVALVPFVALAVTYLVAMLLGWRPATAGTPDAALVARDAWREPGPWVAAALVLLVLAVSWLMWPVWTAEVISYDAWHWRMWLPSWI
jgi:dolichyl-phosphate-mannose--protein O-mannosyl transferase